ncbi:hypothetical protein C8F04DRAFT_1280584 [Mycena alexandri]|uniref:Uncharacterized protein n=1 Tax=Mycena alexandri TaxID=1745969 RepID=A0AAD6RX17_9AGAR|nr:hypothetical protein C8F04DRAFT_1280584 [Mycena alexandri]
MSVASSPSGRAFILTVLRAPEPSSLASRPSPTPSLAQCPFVPFLPPCPPTPPPRSRFHPPALPPSSSLSPPPANSSAFSPNHARPSTPPRSRWPYRHLP